LASSFHSFRIVRFAFFLWYIISDAAEQGARNIRDIIKWDNSFSDSNRAGNIINLPADPGYGFVETAGSVSKAVPVCAGREVLNCNDRLIPADLFAVPGKVALIRLLPCFF